jgi:putative two-component system response regulator
MGILKSKVREDINEQVEKLAALDIVTAHHSVRVAYEAAKLAELMGMEEKEVSNLFYASILHDIGKLTTPLSILLKPAKLSNAEFKEMKLHAANGAIILEGLSKTNKGDFSLAIRIAKYHHEKFNGEGYNGLKGEMIPFEARLVQVVDVFDALISDRPYKPGKKLADVVGIMDDNNSKGEFDPVIYNTFRSNIEEFAALFNEMASNGLN